MKNKLLGLFCCLAMGFQVFADSLVYYPSGQEGHGGDMAVSTFIGIARTTCDCLRTNGDSWKEYPLLLGEFESMIQKAKVYSVDKTILDGHEVDAINYPDVESPKILLNRDRWMKSDIKNDLRAELILHEYLSLIGYEDSKYQISYPIIKQNTQCINQN